MNRGRRAERLGHMPGRHTAGSNASLHSYRETGISKGSVRAEIKISEGADRLKAIIDKNECSGCGACESVCPADAISVADVASVNAELCTGCGACAGVCPLDAISMK